ncbi:MAG: hypothetical protein JWP64_4684 [Pseudonocardia sp.]|nr:hypothetical protein [Pseudonocardia sp.]
MLVPGAGKPFGESGMGAEHTVAVDERGNLDWSGLRDYAEQQQVIAATDFLRQLAYHPAGRPRQPREALIEVPFRSGKPISATASEEHRQVVLVLAEDVDPESARREHTR